MSHAAASPPLVAGRTNSLTEAEHIAYRAELARLSRWYPHAPAPLAHQAAFLLASERTCADALLISAEGLRAYAAEFAEILSTSAANHLLDMARHLDVAAPARARRCA